jgi:hypothetical protein
MSSLADLPELVGFFSYSREDDADSHGALSALRNRIQGELRGQLGRTTKTFRLWQDKEAIASGTLWESEIKNAIAQSALRSPLPVTLRSPSNMRGVGGGVGGASPPGSPLAGSPVTRNAEIDPPPA